MLRPATKPARTSIHRRAFLKVAGLSGAGFLIGCGRGKETAGHADTPTAARADIELGPFIRIGSDNTVTVIIKHLDKGQGVTTGLPTIVAEELDADWSQMRAEFAPADAGVYNNLAFGDFQATGGSTSVAYSWMQLRQAAAGARAMLVQAAAGRWQVPADEITVSAGTMQHAGSGRSATFGELAAAAADVRPPAEPALKDPAEFTLIGTRVPRLDSVAKTDGSAVFTSDISVPGMLVALVAHPPRFGAKVASFDPSAAMAVPGVNDVVEIPRGIAVLADSFWAAKKGRDALTIDWDFGAAETRSSGELFTAYKQTTAAPELLPRNSGDAVAVLAGSGRTITHEYHLPYLAHATMEPMNCVVELFPDRCLIRTASQLQTGDQYVAAGILGLQPEQVDIETHFAGGSFGRRAVPDSDYVAETVMIAKAIGGRAPVKLYWTREDDMRGGRYRPMSHHLLDGAVDDKGNITAWRHRVTVQSVLTGTSFEGMVENGIDPSSVEGAASLPYAIPHVRVELHQPEIGVPVLWWRSVGHSQNAFVTETFFDELAHAGGKDPVALRRDMLVEHPRYLAVLNLAAEQAGWGEALEPGRGRGLAIQETYGTLVAEVVDVTVADDGSFTVDRVVCAVDCGIAVNPDVIRAQMEGGIAFALSAALREEITLENGEVVQGNFDTYRLLRIDEMPEVEVYIVPSTNPPSGVGEPGVPPLAPALANAIYAATGRRITRLPIADQLKA